MASFEAAVTDPEDGEIVGNAIVWSSNIDGVLGYGPAVATDQLSPGVKHAIMIEATPPPPPPPRQRRHDEFHEHHDRGW